MRTSIEPVPVSLAIVRITGLYAAVAVMTIGAAYGTARFHGIQDARAGEVSLTAVVVVASLWLYAMYRLLSSTHAEAAAHKQQLEPPDRPPHSQNAG